MTCSRAWCINAGMDDDTLMATKWELVALDGALKLLEKAQVIPASARLEALRVEALRSVAPFNPVVGLQKDFDPALKQAREDVAWSDTERRARYDVWDVSSEDCGSTCGPDCGWCGRCS